MAVAVVWLGLIGGTGGLDRVDIAGEHGAESVRMAQVPVGCGGSYALCGVEIERYSNSLLSSLPFVGGLDALFAPAPVVVATPEPVLYVSPVAVLCYRPDLVSCAAESRIAFVESTYGVGLYNPTPAWVSGVEHHAIGWFGMLYPLHAHHGLVPGGGLRSDTAAFYSLIEEQGLAPWAY